MLRLALSPTSCPAAWDAPGWRAGRRDGLLACVGSAARWGCRLALGNAASTGSAAAEQAGRAPWRGDTGCPSQTCSGAQPRRPPASPPGKDLELGWILLGRELGLGSCCWLAAVSGLAVVGECRHHRAFEPGVWEQRALVLLPARGFAGSGRGGWWDSEITGEISQYGSWPSWDTGVLSLCPGDILCVWIFIIAWDSVAFMAHLD